MLRYKTTITTDAGQRVVGTGDWDSVAYDISQLLTILRGHDSSEEFADAARHVAVWVDCGQAKVEIMERGLWEYDLPNNGTLRVERQRSAQG